MSNSTAVVPVETLDRYAETFAKSGLFGAKTKEQALSLLLLAHAEGVHPAIAMRDFDIIQGRPAKKAEAMHRAFISAGGKIEWHALTDDLADATFSHPNGGTVRISWDMARAKKAGIGGKDMYSKYPRQMLKARCISEGCRTVYPAATSGLYVPDEVVTFAKTPQPAPERDMGTAHVVTEDEDITQQIQGVGKDSAPQAQPLSSSTLTGVPAEAVSITQEQCFALGKALSECDEKAEAEFLRIAKLERIDKLASGDFSEAMDWVKRRKVRIAAGKKAA